MVTDSYTKDKRTVSGWIATLIILLILAAITTVGGILWAHESSISRLSSADAEKEKRIDRMDNKLDKILERLPPPASRP